MQLSSPYVDMTGSYTLTLTTAGACNLPPEMRTRTYPVSIARREGLSEPHQYHAVLAGGTFVASPLLGRFPIDVAGTFAYFYLGNPYDWTDAIVEEVAPSTYLAMWQSRGLTVDRCRLRALEYGGFEYCVSSTSPVTQGWYRCPVAPVKCDLQRFELVKQ